MAANIVYCRYKQWGIGTFQKIVYFNYFLNRCWRQFDFVVFNYFSKTTIHGTQQSLLRSARRSSLWNTSKMIKDRNPQMSDSHLVLNLCCAPAPSSWTTTYFFSLLRNVLILLKAFPPLFPALTGRPSWCLWSPAPPPPPPSSSPTSLPFCPEWDGLRSSAALLLLRPCC